MRANLGAGAWGAEAGAKGAEAWGAGAGAKGAEAWEVLKSFYYAIHRTLEHFLIYRFHKKEVNVLMIYLARGACEQVWLDWCLLEHHYFSQPNRALGVVSPETSWRTDPRPRTLFWLALVCEVGNWAIDLLLSLKDPLLTRLPTKNSIIPYEAQISPARGNGMVCVWHR